MSTFRTTATHDGREVPMPEVNAATCGDAEFQALLDAYYYSRTGTRTPVDRLDIRDRIVVDTYASAAPSEDAIRAAKFEAIREAIATLKKRGGMGVEWGLEELVASYAPRSQYAPPVALSPWGGVFGQTGPDEFTHWAPNGTPFKGYGGYWRMQGRFAPADGKLVLGVLDAAEAKR